MKGRRIKKITYSKVAMFEDLRIKTFKHPTGEFTDQDVYDISVELACEIVDQLRILYPEQFFILMI